MILKNIKSQKIWTDSYENCAQLFNDFETLYEFYQAGDVSEEVTVESMPTFDGKSMVMVLAPAH